MAQLQRDKMDSSSSSSFSSYTTTSSSSSSSYTSSVSYDDTILEPSKPNLSTLRCPTTSTRTRASRHTFDGISRKNLLKKHRGCRRCVECGFWKNSLGFVRSLAQIDSPRFELRTFRTCNQCSRFRKNMDEEEHFELYGARDVNP